MRIRAFWSSLLVLCLACAVMVSAQSTKFAAERSRLHQDAVKARAALGVDVLDPILNKKYPGAVTCGKNFYGGGVELTGTMTQVK